MEKLEGYIILMDINGKQLSSPDLAKTLSKLEVNGNSTISFVIGGSFGVSQNIKDKANMRLSFSPMTFPHQLIRVFLLEQLFRAFKISNNETYHW